MVSGITLNRTSLTLLILLSVLVPVSCGLALAFWTAKIPEPLLDARIRLDAIWVDAKKPDEAQRLIPSITVLNPTTGGWRNLSIGLNKQFYATEPKGIPAGEMLSIPLEAFIARNGSVPFPVGNRKVHHVTVFAQTENGARAVGEFAVSTGGPTVPKSTDSPEKAWIAPSGVKIK
jgi:hypothetical protein